MAKYLSNRQKNLKIGIVSYTESNTVLEVTGKVGIGTTNATSTLSVVGDGNFTGVVTAGSFSGNSSSATQLQNSRTFEITGDIVASPISFNGTGNVSLAATIQPNSVGLGTDTYGDYVKDITGTANQITVTSGTGEGSSPILSIPNQFTAPQDVTVTRDLQVNRNLNVNGNITIGGTTATLFSQTLNIYDPDIVLGYRTDANNNDISTDNTANHGGVALASTEGNPLVQLFIAGIETNPATYKKFMWFKSGTFAGLGTDAWISNYAIGIGSTQVPNGVRLAAGGVQFTENDLSAVRNINASGIITSTGLTVNGNVSINNGTGNVLNLNNGTLFGVGNIVINDPGPDEGIQWNGGSGWRIYEAPDTLANAGGNLQFNLGSGRLFTMRTDGSLSVSGIVTATGLQITSGITTLGITTFTDAVSFGTSAYFGDNDTLNFGDGNDLRIYHDGSHSYIRDAATGNLYLESNGGGVIITKTGPENIARFLTDGAVELYYDNTKEFETTGYGATVFGILQSQGLNISGVSTISVNTSTDALRINQLGTGNALVVEDSANPDATPFVVTGSGSVGIGTTNPGYKLSVYGNPTKTSADGSPFAISSNDATNPFQFLISRSSSSVTRPYWAIESVEQSVAYRNLSLLPTGGNVTVGSTLDTGTSSQPLQVTGGAYVSGSVGIGTTNPSSTLDVRATGATIRVQNPAASNYSVLLDANNSGPRISLGQNGDNVFVDFGAYSSTNNLDTKARDLRLFSTAAPNAFTLKQDTGNIGINTRNPEATLNVVPTSTSIAGLFSGTTSSDMFRITQLGTGNALVVEDETNPDASPFVVTGVGTVGIGITNPSVKLTVNGGLDSSNRQVRFVNSGTGDLYIKHANLVSSIEAGSSVQLALGGNGAEVVRINSTGVGIGTTNPTSKLSVVGDGNFTGVVTASSFSGNASSATYATSSGIATYASTAGVSTSVIGGIGSVTQLNVSGVSTVGFITATNIWNAGITTSSRITLNGANDGATGGGQIYLNGTTGNRIDFNGNGVAAPTFTTRSAGTKITLYPSLSVSSVDYGLGVEGNTTWYSIPQANNSYQHRWYAGQTQLADLKGSGELVIGSTSLTGTSSQPLQVTGGAYISGNLGVGTTNPISPLEVSQNTTGFNDITITNSNTGNNTTKSSRLRFRLTDTVGSRKDVAYIVGYPNDSNSALGGYLSFFTRTLDATPTEKMRLDNNGNLVLGSSFTATGTSSQPLQVTGGAYVSTRLGVGVTNPAANTQVAIAGTLGIDAVGNTGTRTLLSSSGAGFVLNHNDNSNIDFKVLNGTKLQYQYSPNFWTIPAGIPFLVGTASSTGTTNQLLRVEGGAYVSGSVGIGTTNPGAPFHVQSSGTEQLWLRNGSAYLYAGHTSDRARIGGWNSSTGATNLVLNDAGGNVGVGTTNPLAKFHISTGTLPTSLGALPTGTRIISDADSGANYFTFRNTSNNNTYSGLLFQDDNIGGYVLQRNAGSSNIDADCMLYGAYNDHVFKTNASIGINATGVEVLRIKQGGNVGIGTTNPTSKLSVIGDVLVSGIITSTDYNSTSDINLKENIQKIENPVDKVLQLNGVSFNWKESGRPSMGVIAQEVEKVIPELVNTGDVKTVNYNGLIGLLIEVVKEQQKEIDYLKGKIG